MLEQNLPRTGDYIAATQMADEKAVELSGLRSYYEHIFTRKFESIVDFLDVEKGRCLM